MRNWKKPMTNLSTTENCSDAQFVNLIRVMFKSMDYKVKLARV